MRNHRSAARRHQKAGKCGQDMAGQHQTVLICGVSSGLGLAVAQALAAAGHRVYAAARSFVGQEGAAGGLSRMALDVTDEAAVRAAVARIEQETDGIDTLIFCAARIVLGSCEDVSGAELRGVLETNFLALTAVVRAVLPGMRARGRGLIMPFSSINGLLATPYTGAYVASKHALEGWAEALRLEVRPFGVRVCVVRPGDHRGGSTAYRQPARAAAENQAYQAAFAQTAARIAQDEAKGLTADRLARAVTRAVSSAHPPAQLTIASADQRLATWLHDLLPTPLFGKVMMSHYIDSQRNVDNSKGNADFSSY